MNKILSQIQEKVYNNCGLVLTNFTTEIESKAYAACQFQLSGRSVICRNAKITPTKTGQFVTFWKRDKSGVIAPYNETDSLDFYVVNVQTATQVGQFVFPKAILIKHGIISTSKKEGKRAFRVYPGWNITNNKQAQKTQAWQLHYFYEINTSLNLSAIKKLYAQ
ncbi:MepB family protein [Flavicella sediminum]|uniref:MepB family protein n=1 Tax=Flavicella sediminum TaxID=2585141 RepID=UPI0011227E20|nr:MepB family protein [Flavicella sediminum]